MKNSGLLSIAVLCFLLAGVPPGSLQAESASKSKLWAAVSASQPIYTRDQAEHLQLNFALVNDGDKAIDPKGNSWRLNINGKDLPDSEFIFLNGPRPWGWDSLRPGQSLAFGISLGERMLQPGIYRIIWKGRDFETVPLILRVVSETKHPIRTR